jgi:hypothetical protein
VRDAGRRARQKHDKKIQTHSCDGAVNRFAPARDPSQTVNASLPRCGRSGGTATGVYLFVRACLMSRGTSRLIDN